jgi:hypothetical protein
MPTYLFLNNDTGEFFEDFLTNSKKQDLLSKNPHIQQIPAPFAITSMEGTHHGKTDDTWKEVLSKVAEAHPESTVGQRYGRKDTKQSKTSQIIQKWRNS